MELELILSAADEAFYFVLVTTKHTHSETHTVCLQPLHTTHTHGFSDSLETDFEGFLNAAHVESSTTTVTAAGLKPTS